MRFGDGPSWRVSRDMPQQLVVALYIRDAARLEVRSDVVVPPLEPGVGLDGALVTYATEAAAADWAEWWESLLDWRPKPEDVSLLLIDPLLALPADLRALAGTGLSAAEAWFNARKREDRDELHRLGRPPILPLGEVVRKVERDQGRKAAPFNLSISILPVEGVWGRRVRRDRVLISRALAVRPTEFEAFLEPVFRELAR